MGDRHRSAALSSISTRASSCLASAATMIVPNPGRAPYPSLGLSGVPTPLSETTSLQLRFSRLIGNDNQASGAIPNGAPTSISKSSL